MYKPLWIKNFLHFYVNTSHGHRCSKKVFNCNTIKVSYCCIMKSMGSIKSTRNKQLLKSSAENHGCNRRRLDY